MYKIICGVLLWTLFFTRPLYGSDACHRPSELAGSTKRAQRQVEQAERWYAERFDFAEAKSSPNIRDMAERGELVRIDDGVGYFVEGVGTSACGNYPKRVREYLFYARPEVASFLEHLGYRFNERFPESKLKITSLARTASWQRTLLRCGSTSVRDSPHEWGLALDISKNGRTVEEKCFLWSEISTLQRRGLVTAVDEKYRNNIHVMVHPDFVEWKLLQKILLRYPVSALLPEPEKR